MKSIKFISNINQSKKLTTLSKNDLTKVKGGNSDANDIIIIDLDAL